VDQLIRLAIRERRLIEFSLHGFKRTAEPHLYGVHKGVYQVLVYQTGGGSRSGRLPAWRRVDLDEISQLTVLEERFRGGRLAVGRHKDWDQILEVVE
jgi:hypothetical protein